MSTSNECRHELINSGASIIPRSCRRCGLGKCALGLADPWRKPEPTQPEGALPEPDLEDVDYELWGQNAKADCWFEPKMRAMMAERDAARAQRDGSLSAQRDYENLLRKVEAQNAALRRELEARKPLDLFQITGNKELMALRALHGLRVREIYQLVRAVENAHGIALPAGTSAEDGA